MLRFKELKRLLPTHKNKLLTLEMACRTKDGTASSVCNSTGFNCRRDIPVFFLAMEEDSLVGYLSIFLPEESTAELNVLVHPDYRRKGIFTELLHRAKATLSAVGTKEILFVCEPSSADSVAVMQAMHAEKKTSEYRMLLEQTTTVTILPSLSGNLPGSSKYFPPGSKTRLLEANREDLPLLGRMNALFFDTSDEIGEQFAEESYDTPGVTVYKYCIADENQNTIPIGTVCFFEESGSGNIFGLGILPEYRGRGFGKDLLLQLLARIRTDRKIYLQVSSRNAAAFQLYRKTGFQIIAQQDFWLLS